METTLEEGGGPVRKDTSSVEKKTEGEYRLVRGPGCVGECFSGF